jgi:cytochrome P450
MMEAQLLLATIASRWQITLAPDARVEVAPMITLFPRHGLKMQVNQRTGDALHPKT